jgi:drug/metabolite transporter (DMT)-like permease
VVELVGGIAAALVAAALYSFGVTFQALEAREMPSDQSLRLSLIRGLVRRRRWIAGTACVAGGWAMQALALFLAPITVVQPTLAISVVVLLVIGVRYYDESASKREMVSALAIILGVAGLALVAPRGGNGNAAPATLAIGMTVLGLVAVAPYVLRKGNRRLGALVVFSAGLAYAWTGFSTKFLADGVSSGAWPVGLLWLGATIAAAGIGLLSEMTALQTRSAIRVFPIVLVTQIVVAVLLAPLLAGESWSPNPVLVAGLAVSLVVLAAGTHSLAGTRAVSRVVATD